MLNLNLSLNYNFVQPTQQGQTNLNWAKKIDPLLVLEEKLVEYLLKYGNRVVERKDAENNKYQITVAEEIVQHFPKIIMR